jgi:GcrA cell cycle regulator
MSNPTLLWPLERTERLKKLYAAGLSCSQIAAELNCGLTRNAVIGKVHRLKLERRRFISGQRKSVKAKTPKPQKSTVVATRWGAYSAETKAPVLAPDPAVDLDPLNIAFDDIRAFQCRWITQQQPVLFCGHPAIVGSWCPAHRAVVFTPRTEKRALRSMGLAA